MNTQSYLAAVPVPVLVTSVALAALVIAVVAAFLLPALKHWFRLRDIQNRISQFDPQNYPAQFKAVFKSDRRLAHLWSEYEESLHVQREERDGQMVVRAVRATVPAELYFNGQVVVDSRLRTEFFKHVPGIFTGIGIIGTFSGLIEGLDAFQVSENAATVRNSLESLMHSVGEAFLVSASAIAAAMIMTFLEKLLLAALYRRTEEIAHAIDACFEAGAGEEYGIAQFCGGRRARFGRDGAGSQRVNKAGRDVRQFDEWGGGNTGAVERLPCSPGRYWSAGYRTTRNGRRRSQGSDADRRYSQSY